MPEEELAAATPGERPSGRTTLKWAAVVIVALGVSILLWNFVFPWVMTLLPENF